MTGTRQHAGASMYRDAVAEMIETGKPFVDVEESIDGLPELTSDQKAALWLFAFSLRDPGADELRRRTADPSLQ